MVIINTYLHTESPLFLLDNYKKINIYNIYNKRVYGNNKYLLVYLKPAYFY